MDNENTTNTEELDIDALMEANSQGADELDVDALMEASTAQLETPMEQMQETPSASNANHIPAPSINRPRNYPSGVRGTDGLSMTLKAILGSTELTIGDLEKLSSGDILKLNAHESDLVDLVDVRGVKCASGRVGIENGQYVIEIVDTDSNEG